MASERDALLPRNHSTGTSYPPPRSSSSSSGQPATGTTTATYSEDSGIRRPPPAPLDYSSSDSDDDEEEEGDVSSVAAVLRGRPAIYENASGPAPLPIGDSSEQDHVTEDDHDDGNEADESGMEGDDDDDENAIIRLARRLRCLFAAITWPIVPLGTVVALALFYMLYAAFVLRNDGTVWTPAQSQNSEQDDGGAPEQEPCPHPLHAYAWASLLLALYTPNHKRIRTRLFAAQHAAHTGDGRPTAVRRYDQIFHTLALLYVYAGITLVQTCNEDVLMDGSGGGGGDNAVVVAKAGATSDGGGGDDDHNADGSTALLNDLHNYNNACQATCPALTEAVTLYVATLELFTLSLILPLLFLPCIYLWFLRQATSNQAALAELQQRLREDDEDDDFVFGSLTGNSRRGGAATVTADEILRRLQTIRLVRRQQDDDDDDDKVRIVSTDPAVRETWEAKEGARECCICMSDFYIHDEDDDDEINNNGDDDIETAYTNNNSNADQEVIVRTAGCGHLFHEHCIANWIGGRWEQQPQSPRSSNSSSRLSRAARSPSHRGDAAAAVADNGVAAGGDAANTTDGNNRSRSTTTTTAERQRHRQRRARRTTCPLCRADLRHGGSGDRTQYSTF